MLRPRTIVFVLATATIALAYRLGGLSLWITMALGIAISAGISMYVLWQDEALVDVMKPKGLDVSTGVLAAAIMFVGVTVLFDLLVAPDRALRTCGINGPVVLRVGAHGLTALFEWVRGQVCGGYRQSLGLTGPMRGATIVVIAALEEIAWRGGVQEALSERLGSTRGWIAASFLYGAAHLLTGNPLLALLALSAGLVWGALYRYRHRLVPGIAAHVVFSYFLFHARPLIGFV